MGVDIEVIAPFDHALEYRDDALQALEPDAVLLGRGGTCNIRHNCETAIQRTIQTEMSFPAMSST